MRTTLGALGLSALFFLTAAGQQRPNFSGTWLEDGPYHEYTERIVHQDSIFTISSTMREKPGPPTTLQRPMAYFSSGPTTYDIEGPEHTGKNQTAQGWTSIYWQQSSLVIQTVRKESYKITITREVYTLSDDGDTLTKGRRVVNMDGVSETTTVLHRQ